MPSSNFYESSNGDVWSFIHDPDSGVAMVIHRPNAQSGGKVSTIEVDQFLRETPSGPQHEALKSWMGTQPAGETPGPAQRTWQFRR